jgi:hypothetical protein
MGVTLARAASSFSADMRRTIVVLVSATALLSACGGTSASSRPAAVVNGIAINEADFDELTGAVLELQAGGVASVPQDRIDGELARNLLETEVILETLRQHVESEGLDDIEVADAEAVSIAEQITSGVLSELSQPASDRYVDKARAFLRFEVGFYRSTYDAAPEDWARRCVSQLIVATQAEADAALDRLDDGSDFGQLATEISIDRDTAAAGGQLGCVSVDTIASLGTPFAAAVLAAEVGEPTQPVEVDGGFVIALVSDEQTEFDAAAMRADLQSQISDQLFQLVRTADVEVASRYGTWIQSEAGIEEPGFQGLPAPAEG